jgi:hypothetical protein
MRLERPSFAVVAVAPALSVTFEAIRRRGDGWLVTWRIHSRSAAPLTVVEAWHPHGRFRSSRLQRSLAVPARGTASLELPARIDAGPGDVVENCFVILRAKQGRARWRIISRSTLRMDDAGVPKLTVERVDVHPDEG